MSAPDRRLAAILSADIAGYSRLMAEDEAATIQMVTARRQQVGLLLEQHRGRLVDFTGDNFLAEFSSASDAVECAVQIQHVGVALNAALPAHRKMEFRIGIHLGEVQVQDDRLFGTGVNIAARLEALADPGGVCISSKVHEEVVGRTPFSFRSIGEQQVKNIPDPVTAYAVEAPDAAPSSTAPAATSGRPLRRILAALVALGVLFGSTWWWLGRETGRPPAERPAPTAVVVLPFDDMSPEGNYAYFGEGMSEELTNALAQLPDLKVIGRTSAKVVHAAGLPIKEIGSRLDVGAVVEGSVRRAGQRLRVTVQVIETQDGFHLWSETFDRSLDDVFAVQTEIAVAVAAVLDLRLKAASAPAPTSSLKAYDAYLTGRSHQSRQTPEDLRLAIARFEEATRTDPAFGLAYSGLADALTLSFALQFDVSESALPRAREAARKAVENAPTSAEALTSMGRIRWFDRDWVESEADLRHAIELNPGYGFAYQNLALVLANRGLVDEGIAAMKRAMDLEPLSPFMAVNLATIQLVSGDERGAARSAQQAIALEPLNPFGHSILAGALTTAGDEQAALDALMAAPVPEPVKEVVRTAYAEGGMKAAWESILDLTIARTGDPCGGVNGPALLADAGRREVALSCLERAVDVPGLYANIYVKLHPLLDPLRSEPRFQAVLEGMNLAH